MQTLDEQIAALQQQGAALSNPISSSLDDEIKALQQQQPDGFLDRVGQRLEERQLEVSDTFSDFAEDRINVGELGLQTLGKAAAGGTLDVLGEGLVSVGRGISAITPDVIKEKAVEGFNFLVNTDAGQDALEAIEGGAESYAGWKKDNPRFAKNLESGLNVGILFAPVKVKKNAPPSKLSRLSENMENLSKKRASLNRKKFADDLVSPERTRKVLIDEVSRTTEKGTGAFKRSVVKLSESEKAASAEVRNIGKVSPRNTIQGNRNIIAEHNRKLAQRLESKLAKETGVVDPQVVASRITAATDDIINKNATVVGETAQAAKANLVKEKALELVAEYGTTPSGLLKARRKLDEWLLNNRPNVFDQAANTLSVSGRAIRKEMNNLVDNFAHNTDVHRSLAKQTRLFNALENIAPKAASEGNNAIMRQWNNLGRALPFRNKAIQDLALLTGVGGLGAAATFAPVIAGGFATAAIVYSGGRAIMHPRTAKALSVMIKATDEALKVTVHPQMLKQLRADRALIVEMLENVEQDDTMPLAFGQQDVNQTN